MQLPFYYDYACPWAYLGSCRVEAYFQDLGLTVDFRPVILAQLKEATAGKGAEPGERKKRYFANDLKDWAEMVGAEFSAGIRKMERPDTRLLLRAALIAKDRGRFREFHYPAYRARWAEGRDVADHAVVGGLLEGAGLDPEATLAEAGSAALEKRLEEDTEEAIRRGVFGVPTLFVGDRMFWGNDRFELARHYIEKTGA